MKTIVETDVNVVNFVARGNYNPGRKNHNSYGYAHRFGQSSGTKVGMEGRI